MYSMVNCKELSFSLIGMVMQVGQWRLILEDGKCL